MERSERTHLVVTRSGVPGSIDPSSLPFDAGSRVPVQFESGDKLLIPVNFLNRQEDGSYVLPVPLEEARRLWPFEITREVVIPVAEERPVIRTRKVETGRVRITKKVATRDEEIDEPLVEETVEVERVAVNRPVDQPVPVRYEGDTMIVPVFEETLVVEKRLVLKEELRITRRRAESHRPRRTTLRREEVSVERIPPRKQPTEREEPDAAR
jgi:uncharacterized protein (TIGR02271 family)